MNILALKQSLDNSVWSIAPEHFLPFKEHLDVAVKQYVSTDNEEDDENEDADIGIRQVLDLLYIPINGTLVKGSGLPEDICQLFNITDLDYLEEDLREARDNPEVSTIILDFNSPGGTCHAHSTAQLIAEIAKKKDIIAYSGTMVCSSAYQLAAKCSELYVSETAWVGFVGVIFTRADYTQANKDAGVSYTFFSSSPKKLYLNPNTKITAEESAWIESAMAHYYEIFKADVQSNRTIKDEYLDSSIFIGEQSVTANLADGVINTQEELVKKLTDSQTLNYL